MPNLLDVNCHCTLTLLSISGKSTYASILRGVSMQLVSSTADHLPTKIRVSCAWKSTWYRSYRKRGPCSPKLYRGSTVQMTQSYAYVLANKCYPAVANDASRSSHPPHPIQARSYKAAAVFTEQIAKAEGFLAAVRRSPRRSASLEHHRQQRVDNGHSSTRADRM